MIHRTAFLFRVSLLAALLISVRAFGCDLCGCYIGVLPYDNQSAIGLMHRYRIFSGYSTVNGTIFPSGAYRVSPAMSALHGTGTGTTTPSSKDFESYKVVELRGKWFVHPRLELNLILPYVDNRSESGTMRTRASGIGDMTLLAGYHLVKKIGDEGFRHRLVIGAGIKLPTGNASVTDDDGERLDFMQQTGTGSTDGIVYLAYTGGGRQLRWGATSSVKFSGTNRYGEQITPATSTTMSGGYLLTLHRWNFLPQVQLYQEFMQGVRNGAGLLPGTGMNCLLGGPALSVFRGQFTIDAGLQLRLYDRTQDDNLLNKARMFFGVSWSFNQDKFLLHSKNH